MRDVTPEPEALPDAPETPLDEETAEAVADTVAEEERLARGETSRMGDRIGAESFTEAEQAGIEDVFGDASGAADVEVERAWLKKELDKGLGEKGTEAVTAAIADPHLTAARGRELREAVVAHAEAGGGGARGAVVRFIHAADIHFSRAQPGAGADELGEDRRGGAGAGGRPDRLRGRPVRRADQEQRRGQHAEAAGRLRGLLDAAPVVSVQGTPSHDAPGSYAPIVSGRRVVPRHPERWTGIIGANDAARAEPAFEALGTGVASIHAISKPS